MLINNDADATRDSTLDGLRGMAVIAVILFHSSILGPNQAESSISKLLLVLLDLGWAGVDLFFVLSGFLITRIVLAARTRKGWLKSFFIKRVFRILPMYFLFVTLLLLLSYTIFKHRADFVFIREQQAYFWFMLQNFLPLMNMNWPPSLFHSGHLWTLAVEWQFYMIWPFLAGWLSHRALTISCIVVIIVALASRLVLSGLEAHIAFIYTLTFSRMDSLAIGALVALALQSSIDNTTLRKLSNVLVFTGVGFFLVTMYLYGRISYHLPIMYTIGYTLLAAFFAGLLLKVIVANEKGMLRSMFSSQCLTAVGKYSYAMYIIHLPLMSSFGNFLMRFIGKEFYAQLIYLPVLFIATLSIAWLTWRTIEAPALLYARKRAISSSPVPSKAPTL
ncbi:acyltransferase family protein [Gilvimarinus sp. F26214L]